MRDLSQDQKGREVWNKTPRRCIIPGRIVMTAGQVYYPATGLLEERITLQQAVGADIVVLPRRK